MGVLKNVNGTENKFPVWLRVTIPTIASLIIFLVVLFVVHMPAVRDNMIRQRKETLKDMTHVAVGVLSYLYEQEQKGRMSRQEAQSKAAEIISLMRFGNNNKDYFWISDVFSKMVMHPYMPELDGRDMKNISDFKGRLIFKDMVNATADGDGYVKYIWQWQDMPDKVGPKISHVRRFSPWGWIIGTGFHLKDIEKEVSVRNRDLIILTFALLGVMVFLSVYTIVQSRSAGRQIEESAALFKGIFNHSQHSIGVLAPEGQLLMVNKVLLDFADVAAEDINGKYFWEAPWWSSAIEVQRALKEAIQIASFGGVGKGVFKYYGLEGKSLYVDFSVKPVLDDDGGVMFLVAEGHNITELKEAQDQLALSEALFKGVFNQSLQFMGVVGLDGILLEVNNAALDIHSVKSEDVIGKPFSDGPWWQNPPSLAVTLQEDIRRALDGHMVRREVKSYPDGFKERYVDFSLKPAFGPNGDIIFLLAEGRDITELRYVQDQLGDLNRDLEQKVEERTAELKRTIESLEQTQNQLIQSEKMAALGDLVAGVAHEINTPVGISVTSISFMEEKLKEIDHKVADGTLRKSDFDKFLSVVREATKSSMLNLHRAAELIGNFKQVAVDQASGQKRTINLAKYVDEILLSLRSKYKRTRHTINISIPEDLLLNTFPGALMQILSNLIINSLIHGFEGIEEGHIDIGAEVTDEHVIIRYTDDGKGMSENNLSKVFEPFFTTKRGQGGTGLGMNIVYNLVANRLSGTISCSSVPGQGTAFTILLPKEIVVTD